MRRLLSVLIAVLMVLTLPVTTGIARAIAEGTTEPAEPETPSQGTPLEMEDLDPATLHVHKLGEEDEEAEEPGDFNPDDLEIQEDMNRLVRVSIFLDDKSAIDQGYDTMGIAKNGSAVAYVEKLLRQQNDLQTRIEAAVGHPLNVKWNLTILVNAISAEIPYKDIFTIQRLEGVSKVEVEPVFEAPAPVEGDQPNTANTSENMVGAQNAWYQLGYTGAGSRVAIIDTGLDTAHQSMDPDAFMHAINEVGKADLLMTQEELNAIPASMLKSGTRNYVNAKIPYAYNYVDHSTRINHQDSGSNHGSHVAGIAAANRFLKSGSSYVDAAETVGAVGMAPDAQLFIMKVFSSSGASPSDYFAALEDAIVLGCDAANLSLGSGSPGWTWGESEYQTKLNNLVNNQTNNHMVLSISAGNAYAADDFVPSKHLYAEDINFHTGGTPGSYINSLGVASADNTLTVGTPLKFSNGPQVFYQESTEDADGNAYGNPEITTIAGKYDYVYIDALGTADDYATVNAALSLSGKIVIVNRGDLSFVEKGNNAAAYNPKAVIIANTDNETFGMNLTGFTGSFPMVMILLRDAEAIKASGTVHTAGNITYYTGGVEVTTQEVEMVKDRDDAEVSSFSSWGVPGSLIMKPEITAPGGNIYSLNGTSSSDTGSGTDQYISYSGTSMAAPHIAGLSAVLMQYLKEKTPANTDLTNAYNLRAIAQSLLMSTATPMINDNAFVSILHQGAGLVEVSNAIMAKSVIMMNEAGLTTETGANADGKVKVELGEDPERKGEYDYSFTLYNISDEILTFELDTYLFTQAISNGYLQHTTALLPYGGVTYEWDGAAAIEENHDVNRDGVTNDLDAQAILDYLTGEVEEDDVDLTVADLDGDDFISTVDAKLLLDWQPGEGTAEGYTVAPHDKAQVTVHIKLTDAQKAVFEARANGGYIEGYTYVSCVTSTDEGVSYDHEHTIPILGYYGNWTDPSMFDTNSYTESLYGNEQQNYSGSSAESTNYMRIIQNGVRSKFSGNPYMVEEEFPTAHLAIRSDTKIDQIVYNMIRSAAGTGFAISKLDDDGNVSDILASTLFGVQVYGCWFNANEGTWQNTATKFYSVNRSLNEFSGLSDGDRVRVGFYAIPEYYTLRESSDLTATESGRLTADMFRTILSKNVLGKGAFMGFDLTIDDVEPQISTATLSGNMLTVSASDDKCLAYVAVLSLDGTVKYLEQAPGSATFSGTLDVSDAIANANGYVAVFAGDYAGNEVAKAVKVNDNFFEEKTVYVLTDTISVGDDYLIVNTNTAGTGYGLYYTMSGTTATAGAYSLTINAGIAGTDNKPYIDSNNAASTGIWTSGTGSSSAYVTFSNSGRYMRCSNNTTSPSLQISTDTSRRDWEWNATNHTLRIRRNTQSSWNYLRYYNNTYSINTATNSVYLYVKTTVLVPSDPIDPYSVDGVTVTPASVELYRGDTAALNAKVTPLTVEDRTVTWSSSNPSIATVDEFGVVTGVAAGTATIRATSNADNTKFGECAVTIVAINKELSAAIWDEEGDVYFSYFNANNLPTWTKRHNTPTGVYLTSAFMHDASNLYACTNDLDTSIIYSVNRNTYALTEYGENFVPAFGMARGMTAYISQGYTFYVYAFAKYLILGNLPPEEDEEGTYSGFPYGLLDLSETNVGDAYAVAVCAQTVGTTSASYYFLDENGKIWQTTVRYSNGFSFSTPTLVYDTGVTAGLQYNSIYYDGTNLYWTHQQDNEATLYILANANNSANRKFYHAGNFGDGVWPAAGLYVNGSAAPASVEPGDEIMSEELVGELNLKPLMSREELMSADIMARFAEEAQKNVLKNVTAVEPEAEPEVEPVEPEVEPEVEPVEPEVEPETEPEPEADADPSRAHLLFSVSGIPADGTIPFSESVASSNGLFAVAYDTEALTLGATAKGTANNLYVSIHRDEEKGVITVAYAVKGETALTAGTTIATAAFTAATCGDAIEIEVDTLERNTDVELDEIETILFAAGEHDWDEPTYEWTKEGNNWKCTATVVCKRDATHTLTETVTADRTEEGDNAIYTATFTNELFGTQIKTVEIGYYLIGTMSSWYVEEPYKFAPNGSTAGEYILNTTLAIGDEIKVVRAEGTNILTWYPDGNDNYIVDYAHSGSVNVYFRPAGNSDWYSFFNGGFFYISKLHTVTVITDGYGEATLNPTAPDYTAIVYVTTTPNDGYHYDRVELYQKVGAGENDLELITLDWNEENKTFTMPDFDVVIKVFFAEHTYGEPTYEWAADNSAVTAKHVCGVCGHEETETVNTTVTETAAGCETAGTRTYTATFTNPAFATQTVTEPIPATGHVWGEPTYEWAADLSTVTAKRVCANDPAHVETETVNTTVTEVLPTCEAGGSKTYTATFANEAFVTQTKTLTVPATGHVWGEPTYEWADDNSTVTATAICANDPTHVLTETVTTSYEVTKAPTATEEGTGLYTATFTNEVFGTQTKEVVLPKLDRQPTKIVINEEDVEYRGTTPYVVWNHTKHEPRFTVVAEDGTVLTEADYTVTYRENDKPGTGYIFVTVTNEAYADPDYAFFKIYLEPTEWMTIENVADGIRLEWAPVTDAAGYVIYRRAWNLVDGGWTTFERWDNTTETTWLDGHDATHKVYAGTRYQYGVKAYFTRRTDPVVNQQIGGNVGDNFNLGIVGPLKTTVRITTRTLTSVTAGTKQLTVKWAGSKVFTGYQIKYAEDANFTKNVKSMKIDDPATVQKVITGLVTGKTYYVTIRSYQVFEGMTYFGEWSNVLSAKVK